MVLAHPVSQTVASFDNDFNLAAAAETAEGTFGTDNLAVALQLESGVTNTHWRYSSVIEGRTGEVAVLGIDLDGGAGCEYSGPSGTSVLVRVENLDVSEGTIAPEATDSVTAAVFLNNDIVALADEGYVSEIDTETAVEFNVTAWIPNLQESDAVRIALIGGGEEVADWAVVDSTGEFMIMNA